MIYIFCTALLFTFIFTVSVLRKLIPYLEAKKIGQIILDIGPSWHKSKEGTPTMGGVAFVIGGIIASIVAALAFGDDMGKKELLTLFNVISFCLLNALIGLIDDLAKMKKSKNEGLTPKTKLIFQAIAGILFLVSFKYTVGLDTSLYVPYFDKTLQMGALYYPFALLILCGVVNSVNLTDGLDGLASSVALTVGIFITYVAIRITFSISLTVIGAILIGSTVAFLIYNLHPAKIFMGDTGSLFLGAMVVSSSFVMNNPLIVLVYGFVFIIEALSDIIQVGYYKISKGKRIFKMAPLHHHFEKCGFSEMRIVSLFTSVNFIFCLIALFGLGNL